MIQDLHFNPHLLYHSLQIWGQCQGGPLSGEDQTVELHIWPQSQKDHGERERGHRASHLPHGLVDPVLQHRGADAAGGVRRYAFSLRMCGGK